MRLSEAGKKYDSPTKLFNTVDAETEFDRPSPIVVRGGKNEFVLILVGQFLPGYKAGGAIRSVANLIEALGAEFDFRVVTSDRDLGDRVPYPGVAGNQWVRVGNAEVMYITPGLVGFLKLTSLLRSMGSGGVLYLNSFFSPRFSIYPMILRRLGVVNLPDVLLAPRGEFSVGALQLKARKKALFITLVRWLGTHTNIVWHASSELEEEDIKRAIDGSLSRPNESNTQVPLRVAIAEDIAHGWTVTGRTRREKVPGRLDVVFASRISPKKNLIGALKMLGNISGEVSFSIYGPMEDSRYWRQCQDVIGELPSNIHVKHHGTIEHGKIGEVFAEHDLFLLPSLGENFGHVISEALAAGCPVLISDQTPWRNLEEKNAGWDIPLDQRDRFRAILQYCVNGDEAQQAALSKGSKAYIRERISSPHILEANRRLFSRAICGDIEEN